MPCTPAQAQDWLARRGWQAFDFQSQVWAAMASGRSGLLHANTGAGKTLAAWLGALARAQALGAEGSTPSPPLQVLWLTPMRALAADSQRALALPANELAPHWTLGLRTSDTPPSQRAAQDKRLPTALVTTPESLSLLLTRADARQRLSQVHTVVVDEWHELLGNKRGVQVQLALARLRGWRGAQGLCVWGLSATLGNLDEAAAALHGRQRRGDSACQTPLLVRGRVDKRLVVDTLLPADPGRFSWGGHLGAQMRLPVVEAIAASGTTLVFTNVRSQAEAWYQMLLAERPDWAGQIALHHGSLDKSVREWVEAGLKAGTLKAVVATSSLDLGVDFLPVERVLQIGSAKGVARLLQRAGRSGHQPGRDSRITLVPTNTLELIEAVALRRAVASGRIESRQPPEQPLDVLVQHLVTVALGGGFNPQALWREVRQAHSYRRLCRAEFDWALDFVVRGGASLGAYPQYHRVASVNGRYTVPDRSIALRHRMQVGTIVSEASMSVQWVGGGSLGQIEESFIARLKPGDNFIFGGRVLALVRAHDMVAQVRKSDAKRGLVPAWAGGKMALSSELADATLAVLTEAAQTGHTGHAGTATEPELLAAQPMLDAQARLSALPTARRLLVVQFSSSEGQHLFIYPFAGRTVHLGLASLLAWRLARGVPNTFSISVNDYGFELLAAQALDAATLLDGSVFSANALLADVQASLNSGGLAQRRFREIARVAGLVFSGYPGAPKSNRALQASTSLFFEVFRRYDPDNKLLAQADAEVLSQELDLGRLSACLQRLRGLRLQLQRLSAPSPFALALMVERFREQLSTEKLADRLARILADAQHALDAAGPPRSRP